VDNVLEPTADEQIATSAPGVQLEGGIEPVKVSLGYKFGLLLVTFAMILLPVIYLALIALAGYGVYYHATENVSIFSWSLPGRLVILSYSLTVGR